MHTTNASRWWWGALILLLVTHPVAAQQCCTTCIPCTATPTPTPIPPTPIPPTPTLPAPSTFTNTPAIPPTPPPTTGAVGGIPLWGKRAGGASVDAGTAVAAQSDGTLFVAGFYLGSADFGGIAYPSSGMDIFLAKYMPTGLPIWVMHTGNSGSNQANAVAVDAQGNVYMTGRFQYSINFGCGILTSTLASAYDIFLVKYSNAGTCLWSKGFGSGGDDMGYGVTVDANGNVIMTGVFMGNVTFDGDYNHRLFGSAGSTGNTTFITKFAPTGVNLWQKAFSQNTSNNGFDQGMGVAVDPMGDVLAAGYFQGTEYFDNVTPTASQGNSEDIYVVKLAGSTGALKWVRTFGGTGMDRPYGIATDSTGAFAITGYFAGTVDFGGVSLVATGPLNGYVAKYTPTGSLLWVRGILGSGVMYAQGITTVGDGFSVTGQFQNIATFSQIQIPTSGQNDAFIASYGADGTVRWARNFGGIGADIGYGITTAPDGVVQTGYFRNTAAIGPVSLQSAGQTDIDLLKLVP